MLIVCNFGTYGNGDVRPARVCFSGFNRVSNLSLFVLIRVSVYQFLS